MCEDIVKSIQIIPVESVLYKVYQNAIGDTNMEALASFKNLPMYNFGVVVVKDMEEKDKAYLEQNIQMALQQQELDLEDAIAVRGLKDVNQAERLLVVRRKKRMALQQQIAMQNSQQQAEMQAQIAQQSQQAKLGEMQAAAQFESQKIQMQSQLDMKMEAMRHEFKKEIEIIKAQATLGFKEDDKEFKEKLEVLKETRKDDRLEQQTSDQSKLIAQRQGKRGELPESSNKLINALLNE